MTDTIEQNVLKRKAVAGRPRLSISAMSPAKALRVGLAKAAHDVLRLALVVDGLTEERLSLSELLDSLQDRALFAVLNGPAEGLGLVALSPQAMAAVVEMQTMGRVTPGQAPDRRPTRTDATMAVTFIDRIMEELETALAEDLDVVWAGGFRYASFLNDPRPLGLLLEDAAYRVYRLDLDLALGTRQGQLLLALPAAGRGNPPERKGEPVPDPGVEWARTMEQTVLGTPAQLDAVLHRMTVPLSAVLGLKPGDTIPLPMAAVSRLRLEGAGATQLSIGHLGQARGFRAIRLTMEEAGSAVQTILEARGATDR